MPPLAVRRLRGLVRSAFGLRWRFSAQGRQLLQGPDLDLLAHIATGAAGIVKHGPHRTVYRISLNGLNVYWKHCRINGIASYLRQWIRPAKARLEFDRALRLAAVGIDTVEPLAWAKTRFRRSGPSHLITRELAGACSLHVYLSTHQTGEQRRQAAGALGRYLARLHDAGAAHPDLHPGNILFINDPEHGPRFYLLDIHNVYIKGEPLSMVRSAANLAVFNRWFSIRCERSDRCRFWQAYAACRGLDRDASRQMARRVEALTLESNLRFWHERGSRCVESNRYFHRIRTAKVRGHIAKDFAPLDLQAILDDPDHLFISQKAKILKDSATSTVAEITIASASGEESMIYKRFRLKKWLASLSNRLRPSPALRSWRMGHALLDRGFLTPRPWLVLHRRGRLGPGTGYLLCEKVRAVGDVQQYCRQLDRNALWETIASLGRLLRRFHDAGLSHRDLKAANLLVSEDQAGKPGFQFIDLVGVRAHRRVSDELRQANLCRLGVSFLQDPQFSHTDRLRFLRAYLRWGLNGSAEWKIWWKEIERATREKIARNRRNHRPLA